MPRRKRGVLVDGADARIISQLVVDGRAPNVAIAKAVGLSETAVRRRLARLINNVVPVVVWIDPEALGYRVNAIFNIQVDLGQAEEIGNTLAQEASVRYVAVSLGQYALVVWASFRSYQEMVDFVGNRVRSIIGVHSCQVYPVLRVLRPSQGWNPLGPETAWPEEKPVTVRRHRKGAPPEGTGAPRSETAAAIPEAPPRRRPRRRLASA